VHSREMSNLSRGRCHSRLNAGDLCTTWCRIRLGRSMQWTHSPETAMCIYRRSCLSQSISRWPVLNHSNNSTSPSSTFLSSFQKPYDELPSLFFFWLQIPFLFGKLDSNRRGCAWVMNLLPSLARLHFSTPTILRSGAHLPHQSNARLLPACLRFQK
jgi:hypothetical protein